MAEIQDGNERKDLYRKLLNDPITRKNTSQYSFKQWEGKVLGDEENLKRVADYAVKKNWALDQDEFLYKYAPEKVARAPKQQAAPIAPPPVEIEEEEAYTPEPKPLVGSDSYNNEVREVNPFFTPTLGPTFGGAPAVFETREQRRQEEMSPVFKAHKYAFHDVPFAPNPYYSPVAEDQRRAQRDFAKATKEQQQAALRGGTGFELEQEKRRKERGYGEAASDFAGTIAAGGKRIGEGILSSLEYYVNGTLRAGLPEIEATDQIQDIARNEMYKNATEAQNSFQEEVAKRNIQTSVVQAIDKEQYGRIPEAVLYTVGDAAMQIIPSILTMGGSTYLQTLPQAYKDGVDAVAKEKGISPEQVIANGDDAMVTATISSGVQSALEFLGAGLVSKSMASRGGYKAMRDWLLGQGVNRNLARAASLLGVGIGEGTTEYLQETTGQVGKTAAKSPTTQAFFDKLPKELFTPEARKQRGEAFVGGLIGGMGVGGIGQVAQSAMDRTLFEAPKIGKATQRPDMDVVQTDNKIQERNKIAQAMEEAVKANPEAEGQIRQQYQKRINEAAPADNEVLMAYESLALLPETDEKNTIRENLESYMAEKGLQPQPAGMEAGLGEGLRVTSPQAETEEAITEEVPITEEPIIEEPPLEELPEDLAALGQELSGLEQAPTEEAPAEEEEVVTEETVSIAPLNIDFTKNEGRNVNYQGIEGRIKIDSDGAPYVFTKDGDVVYIEGGLSGQTPQQLGIQPLADDVINEADVETVLEDETAPLDQNQLQYDFDNNTITLYGKPFTYEGVETNSKGQTTALRLRDANGKVKFVRNEDTILEFEIQKELYEKSRTNKPLTVESATAAAEQLQVVPITRVEQVSEPVQQEGSTGNIEGDEVAPTGPAPKGRKKKEAPVTPAPKKEKATKPEPKKEAPKQEAPKPEPKKEEVQLNKENKILLNGRQIGEIEGLHKVVDNEYQITGISINDRSLRGKGYGKEVYRQLIKRLQGEGKILISDNTALSKDAKNVWESLVKSGEAKKTNTGYESLRNQPTAEAKPSSTTPQEGDTVEIAPQREGGSPRKMVFKAGEWKQNVGGDITIVGASVQQQAQEAFAGKAEVKPAPKEEKKEVPFKGITSFETAKGSVYTILPNGKTQRFKTATKEQNEPQYLTVFVKFKDTEQEQDFLEGIQRSDTSGTKVYVIDKQGNKYDTNEQAAGKDVRLALVKDGKVIDTAETSTTPKIGYNTFDQRRFEKDGEKYREAHLGNKVVKINEQTKTETTSTSNLAAQVEDMRSLPPAKRKSAQQALEEQYGKEEVAKMIEITANFTKIIDDLEQKQEVKKDCP